MGLEKQPGVLIDWRIQSLGWIKVRRVGRKVRGERRGRRGQEQIVSELSPFYGSPEGLERSRAFQDALPSSENPCSEKRGVSGGARRGWVAALTRGGGLGGNGGLEWLKRVPSYGLSA